MPSDAQVYCIDSSVGLLKNSLVWFHIKMYNFIILLLYMYIGNAVLYINHDALLQGTSQSLEVIVCDRK